LFKDKEHLVRAAGLFAGGLLAFVVLRALLIPEGFGEIGHFRVAALDDNRAVHKKFAGRGLCETCHDDVAEERAESAHAAIGCEACHGALAGHADDPETVLPGRPEVVPLCVSCHEAGVAKPTWFPQVDPQEHSGGEACNDCHMPHQPEV
jgi:hypothetical protein